MNRPLDSTLETPRTCPKIGVHLLEPLSSRTKIFHFGETENRLKELRESQRRWTAKSLVTVDEYWRQSVLDAPDAVILVTHSKM